MKMRMDSSTIRLSGACTILLAMKRVHRRPSSFASGVLSCAEDVRILSPAQQVVADGFLHLHQKIIVVKRTAWLKPPARRELSGNATAMSMNPSRTGLGVAIPGNDMVVDPCTTAASRSIKSDLKRSQYKGASTSALGAMSSRTVVS